MNGIYKDNPTATYRGYRRQALYCLYRLFDDGLSENTVIQPEGNEDLEIQDRSGKRLEVVQVKDYSADLTVSDFKPSFYRRISDLCASDASVKIKIVSYGPIGPELFKAYDNAQDTPKRALNTLTKDRDETDKDGSKKAIKGLSEVEAREIFKRIEIVIVEEDTLAQAVIEKLKATMTSGNPEVAFENLMWWLISSAEKQKRLTRLQTVNKLTQMGKFIAHRNSHAQEWNVSIKPIDLSSLNCKSHEKLSEEFFQGGRVRAEHVASGLDVPRDRNIKSIHAAFQRDDVVILQGASGQGKTTLAYRYLLDWAPSDFRYQVERAEGLKHARQMAAAITGHAEMIDVPTLIYIDVRPGDKWWSEIVRELAVVSGIRVLVTIREEDWFRSRVSAEDFRFTNISMDFTEESAGQMFANLRKAGYGEKHLDFQDAWSKLGNRKTLFEFVYLVTQNEKLSERVKAQIAVLKDSVNCGELGDKELHLLRLVSIASAYEARLNLKALVAYVGIPEPMRALERFGNEYLLRMSPDGNYVEGFHAIRSEMIAQELTDPVLQPRGTIEALLPPLVVEDDLESLLLCSFSRNESASLEVLKSLAGVKFNTWIGVRAVLVSLQWLGIKQYAAKNLDLVKEVWSRSASGWWFTLDWDLAQINGAKGFDIIQQIAHISQQSVATSVGYQQRQTDKNEVLDLARQWLDSFVLPEIAPNSVTQFAGAGEVLYWHGHLGQANQKLAEWLSEKTISDAWDNLPLHSFARFAAGVFKFDSELYLRWVEKHREKIEKRIRADATIIALVTEDDCLVAHFVIDIDRKSSDLKRSESEASVNELAVQRVEIVSACLPGYDKYGAAGYGHHMSLFESIGDPSTKRIPFRNIKIPWLPEFNALACGAVEYKFRSDTWDDHFSRVRELREKIVYSFDNLQDVLTHGGDLKVLNSTAWDETKNRLGAEFLLPKTAVDEWGFVSESRATQFEGGRYKRFSAISTLDPFNKAFNEYTLALGCFFSQAIHAIVLVPNLRKADSERARQAILARFKEMGVCENSIRLSVINGMEGCIALRKLQQIEETLELSGRLGFDEGFKEKELRMFTATMRSWMLFCYPEQVLQNVSKHYDRKGKKKSTLRRPNELRDCLTQTSNRISHELKKLKKDGVDARILSEAVKWHGDSCLWISFDVDHPLKTLVAIDALWRKLIEAFKPDRDKFARIKAIGWFWKKIIFVPLVQGRSIERTALPNMNGVTHSQPDDLNSHIWRTFPENIPDSAWDELGLTAWAPKETWRVLDRFAAAYGALFHHVDHIADISRCEVDLDQSGEEVLKAYLFLEQDRASPILQETLDTCADVLGLVNDLTHNDLIERPNIVDCIKILVEMKDALRPKEGHNGKFRLTLKEIVEWRNRMKAALGLIGISRYLWIADSLGLPGLDGAGYSKLTV